MLKVSRRFIPIHLFLLMLTGVFLSIFLSMCTPSPPPATIVQSNNSPDLSATCAAITNPLTSAEQEYAQVAWQYFLNNYQAKTGLTNAADNYPSASLWDLGNYLTALNAAHWLGLVNQPDFDYRINQFLTTLAQLPLVDRALPNKVYNTATAQMVDYANQPAAQGIGWSAIDMGRLLTALHIVRSCQPQYTDWINGIVSNWQLERSIQNNELYGATLDANGKITLVQEGRLGYEEYAARGYELWEFSVPKAMDLEPYQFVKVEGVNIPVDRRDYQRTNANNYVVSESYILDGIEFGLEGKLKQFAEDVLKAQEKRYIKTGQLTAVSEDNIDRPPHFLYNTVYANGVSWAVITDKNQAYNNLRTLSTKAAFGWYYLFPENTYAQKLLAQVDQLKDQQGKGFYAGIYEASKEPNDILTGNTNGLVLEILYYKARNNQPLLNSAS
jgi:Protein of unknown function (DUF3131)